MEQRGRVNARRVSAPIEMKSTPVAATSRTVSSVTPPDAFGLRAAVDEQHGRVELRQRHVVEQQDVGAGLERGADVVERLALDLDRHAVALCAAHGLGDAAAEPQVVVLDQDAVVQAEAMVRAAAAAHGELLQRAQARRRLARVEDRRAGAGDGVDVPARQRRDTGQPPEQVQRGALAGQQRARSRRRARPRRASRLRRTRAARTPRSGRARGRPPRRRRARRRRPPPSAAGTPRAARRRGRPTRSSGRRRRHPRRGTRARRSRSAP